MLELPGAILLKECVLSSFRESWSTNSASLVCSLPPAFWAFVCFELVQASYMPSQLLWMHMCNYPIVFTKHCFHVLPVTSGVLQTFCPALPQWFLSPRRQECYSTCTIQGRTHQSYSLHLDQLHISVIAAICFKKKFLWVSRVGTHNGTVTGATNFWLDRP